MAAIRSDPIVRRFYQDLATREDTERTIDGSILAAQRDGFHFRAVERRVDGAFIGMIGIARFSDSMIEAVPGHPEVEIGWQLDKAYWGNGYAPEGASACLAYAFTELGLPEIVAITARINLPSQRVMQKIGMTSALADDFDHPNLAEGHTRRPHVLYRIGNPKARN